MKRHRSDLPRPKHLCELPKNVLVCVLDALPLRDRDALLGTAKTTRHSLSLAVSATRRMVTTAPQERHWLQSRRKPPAESLRDLTLIDWEADELFKLGLASGAAARCLNQLTVRFATGDHVDSDTDEQESIGKALGQVFSITFEHLKHLNLSCHPRDVLSHLASARLMEALFHALKQPGQLETLKLRYLCNRMYAVDQHRLVTSHLFGGLTSLAMCVTWNDELAVDLLRSTNPHLLHLELDIGGTTMPCDSQLVAMVERWPHMQHFELIGYESDNLHWSRSGMLAMASWKDLHTLRLQSNCCRVDSGFSTQLFENVPSWPNLRTLYVTTDWQPTPADIAILNRSCPRLERIALAEAQDDLRPRGSLSETDVVQFLERHPFIASMEAMENGFGDRATVYSPAMLKHVLRLARPWLRWEPNDETVHETADIERFVALSRDVMGLYNIVLASESITSTFWEHAHALRKLERLGLVVSGEAPVALTAERLKTLGRNCTKLHTLELTAEDRRQRWALPPLSCSVSDVLDLLYICPDLEYLDIDVQPLAPLTDIDLRRLLHLLPLSKNENAIVLSSLHLVVTQGTQRLTREEEDEICMVPLHHCRHWFGDRIREIRDV
jgi:hypothetical protein